MARVVRIHEHGGAEVLRFERVNQGPPKRGEVTLAVEAIGLNRSEVMFRNGRHVETATFPARLGYEAAGVVKEVGEGVSRFTIGDRVCLIPPPSVTRWGTYADEVNVPADYVVPIVAQMGMIEAAATWMAAITAYGIMVDVGGLRAGDSVLVLAASSSIGLACIQMARLIGARSIATTRIRAKAADLLKAGADDVIVTGEEDLVDRVSSLTGGSGVRLALDPVAGPGFERMVSACSGGGTIVLYGELDSQPAPLPVLDLIGKGLTVRGFTFKEVVLDAGRRERAVGFIQSAIATGTLRPTIDRNFRFEQIADAQRYLEGNAQFGKIVVTT